MVQVNKTEQQMQLIEAIKNNDSIVLKKLYVSNYYKIEALILKNNGSVEYAKNVYQDAFVTVWKHVKNDIYIPQNKITLQNYLYNIAKNKWTEVLSSKAFKNLKPLNTDLIISRTRKKEVKNKQDLKTKKLEIIMDIYKNLEQSDKHLLSSFYFDKKSLKDITSELKIEETIVRNKKHQCMEKLRAMVLSQKNKN
ncbi:hypothetical protein APS56_06425 [Pseudalgibacter alginicilyticus]|uniref:RNA polymerase sigma-70 region 2 domain-containing protein n=2 Tax=Pseudalgibacter alginicilyticus TaxID=1736674 RepID=A0A0P0D3W8_9FLAO|nr:hypothetical protein APS56_06425 [Pseudalgibacter alginicilyticus]